MIVVLSQGCAANFGDGEKIARILSQKSEVTFEFPEAKPAHSTNAENSTSAANLENAENSTSAENAADFRTEKPEAFYLNVCTVKGNAGAMKLLRKAASTFPGVPIYITGCAPKDFREEALRTVPHVQFTSLKELDASAILPTQSAQSPSSQINARTPDSNKASRNVLRESPFVGIVNIEEGCLDACAFCSTHLVKGRLHSFAPQTIVDQVQALVDDGCLEIQLTGQDCACYGFDIGTNLAELTQRILTHVNGNYRIRLGMGNPRHVLSYQEALLNCFTDDRIYKFIHIPVQSGSENVLKAMNRRHTARDYATLAHAFTERFRKFTLSTDLIVGYPGETAADFNDTLTLLKETRPTVCNITRFVTRPGTVAARLETASNQAVSDDIKHERSAILAEAFQQIALENNREWIGDECTVVTEKPGYRAGTTIARNEAYRPVALQGTFPAGKTLRVRITEAEPFALLAEPLA
ncbi:radical SAM domain protein [Fibrobacter succinogenes subsp. succinogenes S85]|uniref:tRNA (N(6)-L-threonylcarbamoyladenosine(37)-C(2))-methylthiotransferase n=1 Tax=Fibrobacter succinogenes (strain ATCC 19169 / S85) TaxID=59374 RepID=C9RL35_FIBSS|nr:MiaB/RimO family radical SAM methylthiotransferase [Fibrobacter succinogenes]ACX75983.1 Radical SAM domain protein [Fibrobacter succinogenes subsp. succinogenes S85]ADL26467.1 radical SAM domain protein [Fibrobacter succinogenes subsp. succinogenes S85]